MFDIGINLAYYVFSFLGARIRVSVRNFRYRRVLRCFLILKRWILVLLTKTER